MTAPLKNILITRPLEQAQILADKLKALNFNPVIFPAIEIKPIKFELPNLDKINILIFVSPAAIQSFSQQIKHIPAPIQIFTMGEDSANTIKNLHLNWPQAIYPKNHFNRESLLNLPELQIITDKNILIITGKTSSPELADTLTSRGAHINQLVTYESLLPHPKNIPPLQSIDLIIATSQTGLRNLLALFGPELRTKPLLVSSPKLVKLAEELGFVHPPLLAKNAGDNALIQALPTRS